MKSKTQRRSRLQERRVAADIDGHVQSGSGAPWSSKGDARKIGELRVECKYTDKDVYVLHVSDLNKIRDEAIRGGCEGWAFQVDFALWNMKFAVLSHRWFEHMHAAQSSNGISLSEVSTTMKSTRIRVADLWQCAGRGAMLKQTWCHKVTFVGGPPPQVFAITDWHEFMRLKEGYQP